MVRASRDPLWSHSDEEQSMTLHSYTVLHERESPLDPWLESDTFNAPVSRLSEHEHTSAQRGNGPQTLTSATSLDKLVSAFPMPGRQSVGQCTHISLLSKGRLDEAVSQRNHKGHRPRLFLRPDSGEFQPTGCRRGTWAGPV